MKKVLFSIVASLAVATSLYAGNKTVVAPAADDTTSGFYAGIEGGLNVAQNDIKSYGLNTMDKLGWAGGLKLGYDFNNCQNLITPALEVEGLYTSFGHHWDGEAYGYNATEKARVGTFAYMANGIAKVNLGAWQPYVGAGAGFFSAKAKSALKVDDFGEFNQGSEDRDGFAWQLLAGVDYNITSRVSIFTEYKWLNCVIRNGNDFLGKGDLGQHLVTAGVRFHF